MFYKSSGTFALYMYVVSRWKFVLYLLYYFLNKDIHSYFDMIINIVNARLIHSRIEVIG